MKIRNLLSKALMATSLLLATKGFSQIPVANFSVSPTVCSGQTITIFDASSNTPTSWSYTMTGGAPATSTLANPSVVYFAPGTYTITHTATNGSGTSLPVVKTITVIASPNFFINPPALNMCVGGGPLTFFASGMGLTYSWSTGATTNTISVTPSVTTVYTCVATNTAGCSTVRTATATVNPLPTVTITANPTSICAGGTSTLIATATGPGPWTYTWSTGANTASITRTVTGVVTVTVQNSQGCRGTQTYSLGSSTSLSLTATSIPVSGIVCAGNNATLSVTGATSYSWSTGGTTPSIIVTPTTTTTYFVGGLAGTCTGTTAITLTVVPSPTVNATSSPTSICSGSSATLTATGATSYTWNPGGLTGSSVVVTPSVGTVYTVIGSNGACTAVRNLTVFVNPLPNVNAVANPTMVCLGNSSTLTATGGVTYTWSTGAVTATTAVTPTITTTYTVTGTGPTGCIRTRTVTVAISSPTINATATPTAICSGQTATLSATGVTTYTWSTGAMTANTTVTPTVSTTYTVNGRNAIGCLATKTVALVVNANPTVTAVSSPTAICSGSSATLTASGASTYTWSPGGLTGSSIVVTPSVNTTYTVMGINSCSLSIRTVSLIVNAKPTVFAATTNSIICVGQSATLAATGAVTYTWAPGGLTGFAIVVNPTVTTIYTVTGASAAGCTNTATVSQGVSPCTGIQQIAEKSGITIYPNPSNGDFTLTIGKVKENTVVEIYNSIGQMISKTLVSTIDNKINLTKEANGVYHVRVIQDAKQVYDAKVIKE